MATIISSSSSSSSSISVTVHFHFHCPTFLRRVQIPHRAHKIASGLTLPVVD